MKRPRKKYRPKPTHMNPVALALALRAPIPEGKREGLVGAIGAAVRALVTIEGPGATDQEWSDAADMVNVGAAMTGCGLATNHRATFDSAARVLRAALDRGRCEPGGGWRIERAEEGEPMMVALAVFTVQMRAASQGEFDRAVETAARRVREAQRGNQSTSSPLFVAGAVGNNCEREVNALRMGSR